MSANFETAINYFQQSRFDRCLKTCRKVIGADPGFVDAYLLGAQAAQARGQSQQAEKFLLQAAKVCPDSLVVQRNLGVLKSQLGQIEEANRAFRKALRIDPKDAETLYCFAVHLDSNHQSKEALSMYACALEVVPDNPMVWTGLANAQRSMGEFDEARESCLAALEFDANYIPAINNYGALSVSMKDHTAAIDYFHRSLALNPGQPQTWYNLGIEYQRQEKYDKAIEALMKAHEIDSNSSEVLKTLGHTYLQWDDAGSAIQMFGKALEASPNDAKISFMLACGHIKNGDPREARAVCGRFLEKHPGDTTTISCLALMAAEHGPEIDNERYNSFETIIQTVKVPTPSTYNNEAAFIKDMADYILSHSTLRDAGEDHATRNGFHTGNLRLSGMGPLTHLEACISNSLDGYVEFLKCKEDNDFIVSRRPTDWVLNIWGVAMRNQGHQIAHIHPDAWMSGCFYAQLPPVISEDDEGHEGWIEFGAPTADFTSVRAGKVRAYKPIVGSMFLFPGYLTHRTIPFHSDDVRISIAFDVVRK